ncbi:MAG: MotA/TolQ/ExbB proton channel family protein [Thermodesulfobacteriota bacterium]
MKPVWEYIHTGGVVMWPLVLISLLLWGCIIYRLLVLKQLYRNDLSLGQACRCVSGAEGVSLQCQGLNAMLVHRFVQLRRQGAALDEYLLDEAGAQIRALLGRGISLISVLAAVAPLLGLLGTVLGMISTFDTIALFGNSNPRAMAGGISEALVTTQTGLIIAIPGLFMRNFIQRRAAALEIRLNNLIRELKHQLELPASTEFAVLREDGGDV